ncbi:MAG TPA: DUF2812 domain-containing protein, partial [Candidatus Lawsonibacter pullicola]|nr:DUF2812 domain-containing protein [Candidatus Lawsonibacter pullicola]
VTKWSPVSPMDFPRFESWLEEMAGKGFLVHRVQQNLFSLARVKFRRDEPHPHRRYRVCPAQRQQQSQEKPSQELLELYAGAGWTYEGDIGRPWTTLYLFSTDDPEAQEPYTDPDSFRYALRFPKGNLLLLLFLIALNLGLRASIAAMEMDLQQSPHLAIPLVTLVQVLLVLLWVLLALVLGSDLLTVVLLRRRARRDQTVRPSLPLWPYRLQRLFARAAAVLLLTGVSAALLASLTDKVEKNIPLEEFQPDFSLLTLEEMAGDGGWTPWENWTASEHVDLSPEMAEQADITIYYNAATMKRNPIFSPIQTYYIVQQGGTGAAGYGQMDLYYYIAAGSEQAWAQLADLTQRVARERNFGDSAPDQLDFQRETVPGTEEFLVHREEANWDVVALEGDRVLRLTYNGALDLTEWYAEIAAMLTPVNETA